MFHATLDSTKTWKQIVDAMATLLTEAQFRVAPDSEPTGMTLRQTDIAKAAMIDLELPKSVFQDYHCDKEHELTLGIDDLAKVSKRMSGDEVLEFNLDTDANRLELRLVGRAEREFKISLLESPESGPRGFPSQFQVDSEIDTDAFKQAIKDIATVANHVRIEADASRISLSGEGDTSEARVHLSREGDPPVVLDLQISGDEGSASAMYALSYLTEMTKAMSSDTIELHFTGDNPLMIEFPIAVTGKIRFVLAPRKERRSR
ncbi:MAG: proliferating cell nuclear antigen (pcna) [Candidatus Thorarchaeota archaeon]|nr:MAG: proliferating cell nuclear antigen (pcna) [Candidatus Thorarchaeota archaeon]